MKPNDIYSMELWEYNAYIKGYELKQKASTVSSILTGYYCAYFLNSNKKTKTPNELIAQLYSPNQTIDEGFEMINKIKKIEQGELNG